MGDLFDLVKYSGNFSEKTARHFFKQIIDALDHMSVLGKCHRDLKPENIMIDNKYNAKIADFGFCTDVWKCNEDSMRGTPQYMAPE